MSNEKWKISFSACCCFLLSASCLLRSRLPSRRQQSSPSVINRRDFWFVKIHSIPKLTGHRSMRLIEGLAIICVGAASHFFPASEFYFHDPIGIGKRLAREPHDICLTVSQNCFGLCES